MMLDQIYEGPTKEYDGGAVFARVCPACGWFVSADKEIRLYEEIPPVVREPNATCARHGRVQMPFMGFY